MISREDWRRKRKRKGMEQRKLTNLGYCWDSITIPSVPTPRGREEGTRLRSLPCQVREGEAAGTISRGGGEGEQEAKGGASPSSRPRIKRFLLQVQEVSRPRVC